MAKIKEQVKPISARPLPNKNVTNSDTKDVTNLVTSFIETNVTKSETKSETKKETKKRTEPVTVTKNLIIGKKKITANFSSTKTVRPNYNLSEETVNKVEEISELLGYKKAEFLDIYLNGTLTKLIDIIKKENRQSK